MSFGGLKGVGYDATGPRSGRPQVHPHRHQTLLRTVVQIVFNPPPLAVGNLDDAALRRPQVSKSHQPDHVQAGVLECEPRGGGDRR